MLPVENYTSLAKLVEWCDNILHVDQFKDYCPNGLQIEGKSEVFKIMTSVTASQDAIDAAIQYGADALLVHHGYFWKGEPSILTGIKAKRIRSLMQHNISLIAYHLPLDAHPLLGNNAALAELLDLQIIGSLDPHEKYPIGNIGIVGEESYTPREFTAMLRERLGHPPQHLDFGPFNIKKIGFCTGAAQDYLYKAVEQGCDAFISGEISERTYHEAKEYGIHYFACGHHATERHGIQRLGRALSKQFNLKHKYAELANPI